MTRGGKRSGAGRPKGTGKYGEKTVAMRVPESLVTDIRDLVEAQGYSLPLYGSRVQAGFPSPADDYVQQKIDLNQHLIAKPAATFLVRAIGNSMINAGIFDGDLMIVDRSLTATNGKIVIAAVDGDVTVKRYQLREGKILLKAENPDYSDIPVGADTDFAIWGVVTNVIHHV